MSVPASLLTIKITILLYSVQQQLSFLLATATMQFIDHLRVHPFLCIVQYIIQVCVRVRVNACVPVHAYIIFIRDIITSKNVSQSIHYDIIIQTFFSQQCNRLKKN